MQQPQDRKHSTFSFIFPTWFLSSHAGGSQTKPGTRDPMRSKKSISSTVSLSTLPVEIQYFIVQLLDPIGLMSFSQTDRYFRKLIHPGYREAVERLLAIECLEEYGCGRSILKRDTWDNDIPDWENLQAWESNSWACTGCLKLLSHVHFDNHSLLRRKNRKPDPGSPVASAPTSWTPSLHGKTWSAKEIWFFHVMSRIGAIAANGSIIGEHRRWRRCNECLYQNKQLGPAPRAHDGELVGGTLQTPIRRSRFLTFPTMLDRYFPRLFDLLKHKRPPCGMWTNRLSRVNARDEYWATMMMRCLGCQTWQELRSFRFGGFCQQWIPTHDGNGVVQFPISLTGETDSVQLDESRCHNCFLRENGRDELRETLLGWFKPLLAFQRIDIERKLVDSIVFFRRDVKGLPPCIVHAIEAAVEMKERNPEEHLSSSQVECLSVHHREFVPIWDSVVKREYPGWAQEIESSYDFRSWLRHFDDAKAHWDWLTAAQSEIQETPDILVDWALSLNGFATGATNANPNTQSMNWTAFKRLQILSKK